jgi:CRISPR-associated protein Cst1
LKRSGNPFVDTGLCTIAALADKSSFEELKIEDIEEVFNKYDIATINKEAKSFTMIFGTNGPLFQNAYKPKNKEIYIDFLKALLIEMNKKDTGEICEICGEKHNFDIDILWREIAKKHNIKVNGKKYVGRDFFPLIGSIGNDAQALPSASRMLNICPKCLFAVNYIPLGTMLVKGRLICIESTSESIMIDLTKGIVAENLDRISGGNKEIYGKKEGSSVIYLRLLEYFELLQEVRKQESLPETVAIYLWLFSNAGTGADCDMIEIPNKPLKFIWEVSRKSQSFRNEFLKLISKDKNGSLFDCISYGWDYIGLYPKGKYKGVIPEFYEYFQKYIVGKTPKALNFAKKVAAVMISGKEEKELSRIQKSDVFAYSENKNLAKSIMVDLILNGNANIVDYLELFNRNDKYLNTNHKEGFDTIMYYLCNSDTLEVTEEEDSLDYKVKSINTHKKIKTFAELYFKYYVLDKENGAYKGIEKFKKNILDNFKNFDEYWLKDNFSKLADIYECETLKLDYDGWLDFITDEEGNKNIKELMFQLRLAFAELYREYIKEGKLA